jgi:hypothetical protein
MKNLRAIAIVLLALAIAFPIDAHRAAIVLCIEANGEFRLETSDCDCVTGAEAPRSERDAMFEAAAVIGAALDDCGPCVDIPIGLATLDQAVSSASPKTLSATSAARISSLSATDSSAAPARAGVDRAQPCAAFPAGLCTVALRI